MGNSSRDGNTRPPHLPPGNLYTQTELVQVIFKLKFLNFGKTTTTTMKQAQPPDLVVVIATKLRENVDYNQQSSTLFESHFTYKKKP